jgi:hypothetical protein
MQNNKGLVSSILINYFIHVKRVNKVERDDSPLGRLNILSIKLHGGISTPPPTKMMMICNK